MCTSENTDDIESLARFGVLSKKDVFKWCIHVSAIQNSENDKRSDFFTFGPSKNTKFYFLLPATKRCISTSQFSLMLCRVCPENDSGCKIKVTLSLLDLRDRLHNTCERVFEDGDRVQVVFDRSCYEKYHQTFLRAGFIVIYCALDVNEVIQENKVEKECVRKVVGFSDDASTKDLIRDFSMLLEKGLHSDVTLSVGEIDLKAHKAILSARSPIFAAMFEHDTIEKKQNRVVIEDLPADAIRQLLCFLYTGKTDSLSVQDALSLFVASDKYNLPDLKNQCSKYLCSNLTTDILLNVLIVADQHHDENLKSAAIQGVLNNAMQIMKSKDWVIFLKEYSEIANTIILQLALRSQKE